MISLIYALIFFACLGIGALASLLGVGGGFLLVPTLMFVGLPAQHAVGTSVASITFTGLSSFIEFHKQGRVDWKYALLLETIKAPMAILGSYATVHVSSGELKGLFAVLLIGISILMWIRYPKYSAVKKASSRREREITDREGVAFKYSVRMVPLLISCFLIGFSVGFFGVSGGILQVPILVLCGFPIHIAIATSSLMIIITSSTAFVSHAALSNIEYFYLLFSVPGVILGAQLGARMSKRSSSGTLRKMFSLLLLLVAVIIFLRENFQW